MARRRLAGTDLATLLQISQQSASDRLNGKVRFTLDELETVAEWLGISPADLFPARQEGAA